MILRANDAYAASGMPRQHGLCFQSVSDQTRCVIASRAVGIHASGLLLENYATKGFHVKAKSCNWGPMAGFVLADPRFTKRGSSAEALEGQRKDLTKARHEGASTIPVYITDERRKALEVPAPQGLGCIQRAGGTINEMIYRASQPGGKGSMQFVLRREFQAPGAKGLQVWAVLYGAGEKVLPATLKDATTKSAASNLSPVLAMVDPLCVPELKGTYRSAMTGDYDLWAVFAPSGKADPRGLDKRPVVGSERHVLPFAAFGKQEDKHMGNITQRGRQIKDLLNGRIRAAGYTGGNVVHHSDEAGRPKVEGVELDFIAFVPGHREPYFMRTLDDLKKFFALVVKSHSIVLNPGWGRQLGFGATPKGNWEV